MNEITSALKVADTAVKTVRIIDIVKKLVIVSAAMSCGVLAVRFLRK